jgi:hypothetical protein
VKRALLVLLIPLVAHANKPTTPQQDRVLYVAGLIDAIRATPATQLADTARYLAAVERNKCQAPEQSVRVGCILEAAAQSCGGAAPDARDRCHKVSDVIAANRLGAAVFVPRDKRFELMSKYHDSKKALDRELRAQYALRVAEFVLSKHFPGSGANSEGLAAGIEAYCRDVADTRDLSWQYCVAAVVWFVATDGAKELAK